MSEIEKAVIDILGFALGLRPFLTKETLRQLVERRLSNG